MLGCTQKNVWFLSSDQPYLMLEKRQSFNLAVWYSSTSQLSPLKFVMIICET